MSEGCLRLTAPSTEAAGPLELGPHILLTGAAHNLQVTAL